MKTPPVRPPLEPAARVKWWEDWVEFTRSTPHQADTSKVDGADSFWGEHVFIGSETHLELARYPRAVGRQASIFPDSLEYEEVTDLRVWARTKPAELIIHEKIFGEHCYIVGPSGSGKSSLGIMPILIQLMRGAKTTTDERPAPYPVVILDLKGDSALFHTVRIEAEARGQTFQFFFTSPSERECYVYIERGKGLTDPRPYPQLGNPFLRDLAPEEFAYHAELAWPIPKDDAPPLRPDLFSQAQEISPDDVRRMRDEILQSIQERGTDRAGCIINRLFEDYLTGGDTPPTWRDLWNECWRKPLNTLQGGQIQAQRNVNQAVYRAREFVDRYFSTPEGRRWKSRALLPPNEHRIAFIPNTFGVAE